MNMKEKNKKKYLLVLAMLIIIFTVAGTSFALFTFSRLGETSTTITSGDIDFSFLEGDSVTLENSFPISDTIGASDTANMYEFTVKMNSSSNKMATTYNVSLLTNNDGTSNFKNEEIKYNLEKNNSYIVGSSTSGKLISSIAGFEEDQTSGIGTVLANQQIASGDVDTFKLRIWIDSNVNYSGEIDSNGTMTGTKNNYTYSLKVKVDSEAVITDTEVSIVPKVEESTVTGKVATLTLTDNEGIRAYAITETTDIPANDEWTYVNEDGTIKQMATGTNKSVEVSFTAEEAGTYYVHMMNTSYKTSYSSFEISEDAFCKIKAGETFTFDYTGKEQNFSAPCSGNYKLETWGAQGYTYSSYIGGYGGYSSGEVTLESKDILYVNVGGAGTGGCGGTYPATYNGGAGSSPTYLQSVYQRCSGAGGGATHIATVSGELSTLSDYKDTANTYESNGYYSSNEILVVSGGGGGSHKSIGAYTCAAGGWSGGSAGGYISSAGTAQNQNGNTSYNATQTAGYKFGLGGNSGTYGSGSEAFTSAGGGGGWFGGYISGDCAGGGGGSGYIGSPLLTNKTMYCYNCSTSNVENTKTISTTNVSQNATSNYAKQGNGYVRITYLGNN